MSPSSAKILVRNWLRESGLPDLPLSAKTVSFMDLARAECVFVTVRNWEPNPLADQLKTFAKAHGFRVDFKGWPS